MLYTKCYENALQALKVFKGLCLNPYGFYLVILSLDIRWALTKCHIKLQVCQKHNVFSKTFMDMICFYTRRLRKHFSGIA